MALRTSARIDNRRDLSFERFQWYLLISGVNEVGVPQATRKSAQQKLRRRRPQIIAAKIGGTVGDDLKIANADAADPATALGSRTRFQGNGAGFPTLDAATASSNRLSLLAQLIIQGRHAASPMSLSLMLCFLPIPKIRPISPAPITNAVTLLGIWIEQREKPAALTSTAALARVSRDKGREVLIFMCFVAICSVVHLSELFE